MKKPDDWSDSRWMPPSPHKEAILERLAAGRCHIEAQGHGKPPLLVHEDGGVLELPKVRVGSWDLVADPNGAPSDVTKHVDVCGTVDEIEKWLKEEPEGAKEDPERLDALLRHIVRMCGRMERRWQSYQAFAARIAELGEQMAAIEGPDCSVVEPSAEQAVESARAIDYEALVANVEAIRDVANGLEGTLRAYRDSATELAATYEDIRGARNWDADVEARVEKLRNPDAD